MATKDEEDRTRSHTTVERGPSSTCGIIVGTYRVDSDFPACPCGIINATRADDAFVLNQFPVRYYSSTSISRTTSTAADYRHAVVSHLGFPSSCAGFIAYPRRRSLWLVDIFCRLCPLRSPGSIKCCNCSSSSTRYVTVGPRSLGRKDMPGRPGTSTIFAFFSLTNLEQPKINIRARFSGWWISFVDSVHCEVQA